MTNEQAHLASRGVTSEEIREFFRKRNVTIETIAKGTLTVVTGSMSWCKVAPVEGLDVEEAKETGFRALYIQFLMDFGKDGL